MRESIIPGCCELRPSIARDSRGLFIKTFHREAFRDLGLATEWAEQYYSISNRGVLRGLHFQAPPHEHTKLVYCTSGQVLDVVVDLRQGSPAFGRHLCVDLSAEAGNMIYLPPGLAHGFYTLSDRATLVYNVTSVHAPHHDSGIRWDTVGVKWPDRSPLVSERDQSLQRMEHFESPFWFEREQASQE